MNQNYYSTENISKEIGELFNSVEEFITRKDFLVDSIKQMYLSTSTNN